MWRVIIAVVGAVLLGAGIWWFTGQDSQPLVEYPIPGEGGRVTLEVLNGTGIDGLAAATTRRLRQVGLDVVSYGTAPTDTFQLTQILVRRGDSTGAVRIREALQAGEIRVAFDARLLLDVSVILGLDVVRGVGDP